MNEKTKSLIRHGITALGFVLGLIGLNKYTGITDILTQNLDAVWSAIVALVGFVGAIIGFFSNKERFKQGAGIVLLLFCSNFLFASQIQPVRPIGFPDCSADGFHASGCSICYALANSCGLSLLE